MIHSLSMSDYYLALPSPLTPRNMLNMLQIKEFISAVVCAVLRKARIADGSE